MKWNREWTKLPSGGEAMKLTRKIDGVRPCNLTIIASADGVTVHVVRNQPVGKMLGVSAIFRQAQWLEAWLDDRDRTRLADLRAACSEAWRVVETLRANLAIAPMRGVAQE